MAKRSSYYDRDNIIESKTVDDPVNEMVVDSFSYDYENNKTVEETMGNKDVQDVKTVEGDSKSETKKCKVISVMPNAICVDFCGFGVSIEVKNPQDYKKNKVIPVSYSGKIGTPDFKIWVD